MISPEWILERRETQDRTWDKKELRLRHRNNANTGPRITKGYSPEEISVAISSFIDNQSEPGDYKDSLHMKVTYDEDVKKKWVKRLLGRTETVKPENVEPLMITKINCPEYDYYKAVLKDKKSKKLHFRGCTKKDGYEDTLKHQNRELPISHEDDWFSEPAKMQAIPTFWKKLKEIL
tara:strand:- start:80 stop:610 length:531 start_codon:yes stop_codon:yes gene_type:complete